MTTRSLLASLLLSSLMCGMTSANAADIKRLSCSGAATGSLNHNKLPATVSRLPIEIDFDNRTVSGFGYPLDISEIRRGRVEVVGGYRDALGPIRVAGNIALWSGKVEVRATRGGLTRGPLVFLWDLVCHP